MHIELDRTSRAPLYLQIRNALREMIMNGSLPPGYRLPPERKLAATLAVNRSTVVKAYEELAADGFIQSYVGRGTVVANAAGVGERSDLVQAVPLRWTHLFNRQAARTNDPLISNLLRQLNQGNTVNLAAGAPAPELYPVQDIAEITAEIMTASPQEMLEYSSPQGLLSLRTYLSDHMRERGFMVSPDDILVTSGSQQGLDLVARVMLEPGDSVLVEEPSYPGALQVFRAAGARLVGIPRDKNGIHGDVLEQAMIRYRPKFFYTTPTFQNPSGLSMEESERRALLNVAYRCHVPVIEDDTYSEIYYDRQPAKPLAALDAYGMVLYLSTFSKMLFPGLRVAWAAGPSEVIRQMIMARQLDDIHTSTLTQAIVAEYCQRGLLRGHLQNIRQFYKPRRDALLKALQDFSPPGMHWTEPEGGFYIWCQLPPGISGERLLGLCQAARVVFVPGAAFYADASGNDHIRIGFPRHDEQSLRSGIEAICQAVRQLQKESVASAGERTRAEDIAPLALL